VEELAYNTEYTLTIPAGGVADLAGNELADEFTLSFTTAPDTTAPAVEETDPQQSATGVAVDKVITVTFSEPVQLVEGKEITLEGPEGATVAIEVEVEGKVLTIRPMEELAYNTEYTLTIPAGGVADLAGNELADEFTLSFTTAPDTTAPAVEETDPADEATDVPVDQVITITFSEAVTVEDESLITLEDAEGNSVNFTYELSEDGKVLTITPAEPLAYSTNYTLTIGAGAVADLAGNLLAAEYTLSFTTAEEPDTTAPTVEETDPADEATDVPVDQVITITFSEAVTVEDESLITLEDAEGNSVNFTYELSEDGKVLTITPAEPLAYSTNYTLTIGAGAVADLAGNLLAAEYTLSFTTAEEPDTIP